MKTPRSGEISVSPEDLKAALFGFSVAQQELAARAERFRQLLGESPPVANGGLRRGRPPKEKVLAPVSVPVEAVEVFPPSLAEERHPDGSLKYVLDKNGAVRINKDGTPRKRAYWSPAMRNAKRKLMKSRVGDMMRAQIVAQRKYGKGMVKHAKS